MKYAVIFDMDGVLVDSHEMIWSSVNKVLGEKGVHLGKGDINQYVGMSFKDAVEAWNSRYGLDLYLESFTDEVWDLELKFLDGMKLDRGLVSLLNDLRTHYVPMAVGTSSQRFRADIMLDSLDLKKYFSAVISANDVTKHKPEPDLFLKAASRLSMPPERCVVIEDAASGIEAAKRGNMKSVGYENGYNNGEVREADIVINNFSQLSYDSLAGLF